MSLTEIITDSSGQQRLRRILSPDNFHMVITSTGLAVLVDKGVWADFYYKVTKTNNKFYAKLGDEYLHRLIMNAKEGDIVDHINGCTLDNRKHNLRLVTATQNCANSVIKSNSKSKVKGVTFHKSGKWQARIRIKGRRISLGYFDTKEQAGLAYANKHKETHGVFSYESN